MNSNICFVESEVVVPDEIEQERQVWNEVRESMSRRIVELSEKVKNQEDELNSVLDKYNKAISEKEESEKERDSLSLALENEKRNGEGQVEQILRLNEEVIHSMEEKSQLENHIRELESQINSLEEGMNDPKNYYKIELGKVLEDKISADEMYKLKCDELTKLKDIMSEKLQSTDLYSMKT